MGHPYLRSAVGGAHRREYHGGGAVTKFKLANNLASPLWKERQRGIENRRGRITLRPAQRRVRIRDSALKSCLVDRELANFKPT